MLHWRTSLSIMIIRTLLWANAQREPSSLWLCKRVRTDKQTRLHCLLNALSRQVCPNWLYFSKNTGSQLIFCPPTYFLPLILALRKVFISLSCWNRKGPFPKLFPQRWKHEVVQNVLHCEILLAGATGTKLNSWTTALQHNPLCTKRYTWHKPNNYHSPRNWQTLNSSIGFPDSLAWLITPESLVMQGLN